MKLYNGTIQYAFEGRDGVKRYIVTLDGHPQPQPVTSKIGDVRTAGHPRCLVQEGQIVRVQG